MYLLTLSFLFFVGSVGGWVLEVFYRRFFSSANPERKWINPGFCLGPYLPLYGSGLCLLYVISNFCDRYLPFSRTVNIIIMLAVYAVVLTSIEYLSGYVALHCFSMKLWDYSDQWGNFQALICPLFTFFWTLLGAGYYFLAHSRIKEMVSWLDEHLAFSFFIGFFFGVFTIDVATSAQLVMRFRKFAEEHEVVMYFDMLKQRIGGFELSASKRFGLSGVKSLEDNMKEVYLSFLETGKQKVAQFGEQTREQAEKLESTYKNLNHIFENRKRKK